MVRKTLTAIAASLLLTAAATRAGESQSPSLGVPAVPAPAASPREAGEFVAELYRALESQNPDLNRLVAAIDPELLLARATEGLSSRPPDAWSSAARLRLAKEAPSLIGAVFPMGVIAISPRVVGSAKGPAGLTVVTVRFYRIDVHRRSQRPAWHQVYVARTPAGWRLADIDQLSTGDRLSYTAIQKLTDPQEEKLPREGGGPVVMLLLRTLLAGVLIAVVLGLVMYFALVRPAGETPGRRPRVLVMWVTILAPLLVGGVLFLSGLMEHMDRDSAVDEFQKRSKSLALTGEAEAAVTEAVRQNSPNLARQFYGQALRKLELALTAQQWANRRAQLTKIKVLISAGDRAGAEADLKILASDEMDPPMPAARLELSQLYQRSKKWPEAGRTLVGFGKAVGSDALVYCNAAQCFALARDFTNAERMIKLAEEAQKFDNPKDLAEFDGTLLLSRAAVRAANKRVTEVIADFRIFLAPYEDNPRAWVSKVQELDGNLRRGQFNAILKEPEFRKYMGEIQKKINTLIKRRPPPPPPRGGPQ
jgi:tetratricopeptide (TPR) repeat protein